MTFSFIKTVSALPADLAPNAIYAVRVGAGFDLYVSDMTGAVAHKVNGITQADLAYWREIDNKNHALYVQSRGTGLITNGAGLLGDNTNFKPFKVDKTQAKVGALSFYCNTKAANFGRNEPIAVSPYDTYKVSFWAKHTGGGKAYFYVGPLDADALTNAAANQLAFSEMQPHFYAEVTFRVAGRTGNTITIHPDDRGVFETWYNAKKHLAVNCQLLNASYSAGTGFIYPDGTYSRSTATTVMRRVNQLTYADGMLSGFTLKAQISDTLGVGLSGSVYAYVMPTMNNSVIPEDWTHYSHTFSTGNILPSVPNSPMNKIFPLASFIKIGWLMNREADGCVTYISGVQLRQVN